MNTEQTTDQNEPVNIMDLCVKASERDPNTLYEIADNQWIRFPINSINLTSEIEDKDKHKETYCVKIVFGDSDFISWSFDNKNSAGVFVEWLAYRVEHLIQGLVPIMLKKDKNNDKTEPT